MHRRAKAGLMAGLLAVALHGAATPARAENKMGYRLLTAQDAAQLPRGGGSLGMDVDRGQQITDAGLTFDVMRVKSVRPRSAAAQAGFASGDQIIAMDGQVFPTIAAFAAYIGSTTPGSQVTIDYMPAGGGPSQAQRVTATIGAAGTAAPAANPAPSDASPGMSTRTKVAIGVGAVALFGCYELGCFSHNRQTSGTAAPRPAQ